MAKLYISQAIIEPYVLSQGPSEGYRRIGATTDLGLRISDSVGAMTIFKNFNEAGNWTIGSATENNCKIYYFGIQGLPGIRFSISGNMVDSNGECRIGQTGIFEINVSDNTPISEIKMTNLLDVLKFGHFEYNTSYCQVDVIYSIANE